MRPATVVLAIVVLAAVIAVCSAAARKHAHHKKQHHAKGHASHAEKSSRKNDPCNSALYCEDCMMAQQNMGCVWCMSPRNSCMTEEAAMYYCNNRTSEYPGYTRHCYQSEY
eukprot:gnl/Hemi2/8722_TR3022_c0_g1_i1.p1 gnl/Hemi2/8722_TR3022_c0_g1~~gnl/Hemi2/8722_TR3022_c0_g1_i1.p1  ORF type:complete len:111 (+),score=30.85 gnl/Hemi2/8722_TR3022_c0_g1_i1:161-493(+)